MKKLFIITQILFTITFFSQNKKINGFGVAKIGMSITEFNKEFGTKINNSKQSFGISYKNLKITKEINIEDVSCYFNEYKLYYMKCKYSEHLYNGLKKIYGIEYTKRTSKGKEFFKFKNSWKNIICIGLKNKEIVIYNITKMPSKSTFRSINLMCESIKELDLTENYDGL